MSDALRYQYRGLKLNWIPLIQTSIILLLGIIGYLFAQNVLWMRRETASLASAITRLQDAQGNNAVQIATLMGRLEGFISHLDALERRFERKPEDSPSLRDEEP